MKALKKLLDTLLTLVRMRYNGFDIRKQSFLIRRDLFLIRFGEKAFIKSTGKSERNKRRIVTCFKREIFYVSNYVSQRLSSCY